MTEIISREERQAEALKVIQAIKVSPSSKRKRWRISAAMKPNGEIWGKFSTLVSCGCGRVGFRNVGVRYAEPGSRRWYAREWNEQQGRFNRCNPCFIEAARIFLKWVPVQEAEWEREGRQDAEIDRMEEAARTLRVLLRVRKDKRAAKAAELIGART